MRRRSGEPVRKALLWATAAPRMPSGTRRSVAILQMFTPNCSLLFARDCPSGAKRTSLCLWEQLRESVAWESQGKGRAQGYGGPQFQPSSSLPGPFCARQADTQIPSVCQALFERSEVLLRTPLWPHFPVLRGGSRSFFIPFSLKEDVVSLPSFLLVS